jgi:hypothetical protein
LWANCKEEEETDIAYWYKSKKVCGRLLELHWATIGNNNYGRAAFFKATNNNNYGREAAAFWRQQITTTTGATAFLKAIKIMGLFWTIVGPRSGRPLESGNHCWEQQLQPRKRPPFWRQQIITTTGAKRPPFWGQGKIMELFWKIGNSNYGNSWEQQLQQLRARSGRLFEGRNSNYGCEAAAFLKATNNNNYGREAAAFLKAK